MDTRIAKELEDEGVILGKTRKSDFVRVNDSRSVGRWYHKQWGGANAGEIADPAFSPWRPNATRLPDLLVEYNEHNQPQMQTRIQLHPRLRQVHQRIMDVLVAAEPKPWYKHQGVRLIPILTQQSTPDQVRRFSLSADTRQWAYTEQGRLDEHAAPWDAGGSVPFAHIHINGRNPFELARELSYGKSTRSADDKPLPTGLLYVVEPAVRGGQDDRGPTTGPWTPLANSLRYSKLNVSEAEVPMLPKGMGAVTHVQTRFRLWPGEKVKTDGHVDLSHFVLLTAEGLMPVHKFITKAELFDLLAQFESRDLERIKENHAKTKPPSNPWNAENWEKQKARDLARADMRFAVLAELRRLNQASLTEVAIINPRFYGRIALADVSVFANYSERPSDKGQPVVLPSVAELFVADPAQGYRLGRVNTHFNANLKPGEVRSIMVEVTSKWRIPSDRNHGKLPRPAHDTSNWADIPESFGHSFLNNFNWDAIKALLGDGPLS